MLVLLQIAHVFSGHQLEPQNHAVLLRNANYNLPVFILLFICCALLMYVYLRYFKKSLQLMAAVFSYSASQQMQREGYSFFRSFSVSWFLIYMICGGIFFADLNARQGWLPIIDFNLLVVISITALGFLLFIKKALSSTFGNIIKDKKAAEDYFCQYAFSTNVGGLTMLVVCLLSHYSALPDIYLIPTAITLLALLFATRLIKTLVLGYTTYGFSLFHLVLYLCAVEIIPLAVFIKIIVRS